MKSKEKIKLIGGLLGGFEPTARCRLCKEEHTGLVMHQRLVKDDILYDCLFCIRGEDRTRIDGRYVYRGVDRRYAEVSREMYMHLVKKEHDGMIMRFTNKVAIAECMACHHTIERR